MPIAYFFRNSEKDKAMDYKTFGHNKMADALAVAKEALPDIQIHIEGRKRSALLRRSSFAFVKSLLSGQSCQKQSRTRIG